MPVSTPVRSDAMRSQRNQRIPENLGRASITTFPRTPDLGNIRLHRGTFWAFVAGAVYRGDSVVPLAGHHGDITKRRARQYFRVHTLARGVFALAPVDVIPRQVRLGVDRPR